MTQGTEGAAPAQTLRIRRDLFDDIASHRGWTSDAAIAKALGVSRQQVGRILRGEQEPTSRFIAGYVAIVREDALLAAFEVVPVPNPAKESST